MAGNGDLFAEPAAAPEQDDAGNVAMFSRRAMPERGIIGIKQIGDQWVVVRNEGTGNEQHIGYHDSEAAARESAANARVTANRAAGKHATWWVESQAEPIQPAGVGRLDSVSRAAALRVTLAARRYSRRQADSNIDFNDPASAADVLIEWGKQAESQYQKTDATDLADIAKAKGATAEEATITQMDGSERGTGNWTITLPESGKTVTLVDKGGEVYINAARLKPGEGGSRAYDIAAQYALNNGKVFIGDPDGLSDDAMRRRLENMLSSAIKYGATDHIAPHQRQLIGEAKMDLPPLKWQTGDTRGNILSMLRVANAVNERNQPAGSGISYDARTASFRDGNGDVVERADGAFALLSKDDRGSAGPGAAGRTTLQRAALFRALLREPAARRSFLGRLRGQQGDGSAGNGRKAPELDRILYSRDGDNDRAGRLTQADTTPAATREVAALNDALVKYGLGPSWRNACEAVELSDALSGIREAFQAAFGRDVRPVAPTNSAFDQFNGIYIPSEPKTVFVNLASNVDFVTIAGHELWHAIERDRPDLIGWYRSVAAPYYKNFPEYQDKLNKLSQPGGKSLRGEDTLGEIDSNEQNRRGLPLSDELMRERTAHRGTCCRQPLCG